MIYITRHITSKEKKALECFEWLCGLEPIGQDDFNSGEIKSFRELWNRNTRHIEGICADICNIRID